MLYEKKDGIFICCIYVFKFFSFIITDVCAFHYLIDIDCVDIIKEYEIIDKELNNSKAYNESYTDSNQPSIEIDLERDFGISTMQRIYSSYRTYVIIVQVDISSVSKNANVGVYYYSNLSDKSLMIDPYVDKPFSKPHNESVRYEFYGEVDKDAFRTNCICIGFAGLGGSFEVSNVEVELCLSSSKSTLHNVVYVTNGVDIG